MPKAFSCHKANAFKITFPNGLELSTIWGVKTYSDNYHKPFDADLEEPLESDTCEIMIRGDRARSIPKATASALFALLDEKNTGIEPRGPYGHVTLDEWIKVVRILNEATF